MRPAVDLELFRKNADNDAEIGCWVFLTHAFNCCLPIYLEVIVKLS
jgi:hypothetical protein